MIRQEIQQLRGRDDDDLDSIDRSEDMVPRVDVNSLGASTATSSITINNTFARSGTENDKSTIESADSVNVKMLDGSIIVALDKDFLQRQLEVMYMQKKTTIFWAIIGRKSLVKGFQSINDDHIGKIPYFY